MIYQVNIGEHSPVYIDEATNANAKADAEALLAQKRVEIMQREAVRFSICATFINGNDATWREIQDNDPEDTICQVFNHLDGTYTQVSTKTQAFELNESRKQDFLNSLGMDSVKELTEIPKPVYLHIYDSTQYGVIDGTIPMEKL